MAKEETKKTDTVEAPAQATAQATAPAQSDPMALSIGDLKGLASIIDVASTRGAFKAAQLAGVGTLFNKFSTFLATVEAKSAQQAAPEKTTQAPAPTEGK